MKISYFGHSYLLLKGKDYSLCLDPYGDIGLKIKKVKADYVFCSHSHYDHNNINAVIGAKQVENSEIFTIIPTFHDEFKGAKRGKNNVLKFKMDGYVCAFSGDLGEYNNSNLINELKNIDLLFICVGGNYTIDSKGAYDYVKKTNAKAVIPIHYSIKNSTVDIDKVDNFLSLFNLYEIKESPFEFNGQKGVILLTPNLD